MADGDVRILVTVDFDGLSSWIDLGHTSPSALSRGEFGAIGIRRLLALMAEFDALGTFFVPGHTAYAYPDEVTAIREAGHEIGHHGWVHESPSALALQDERRTLELGLIALERVVGTRPLGYRSPGWSLSPRSIELLVEHGFEYDSSMMGNDFEPYWCRTGDKVSSSEPFRFGDPTTVVEIPVSWHLDDVPLFEFLMTDGVSLPGLRPPSAVLEIWKGEFDYLHESVGQGILVLTVHPEVIGRGHRLLMLRELLEYACGHSGVSFSTCLDSSRRWRALATA